MSKQPYFVLVLGVMFGCASSEPARDSAVPIDPVGDYDVHTTYALAAPPASAASALAELTAATDGVDDPSRYLLDLVIARLPPETQRYAKLVAPYLAAYLNTKLAAIAPHFLDGMHAMSEGLQRIARKFGTQEEVSIAGDGQLRRTVIAFEFDEASAELVGEVATATTYSLAGDKLTISPHSLSVDYGQMLRSGLDRVVIPSVDPGATDLGQALRDLVDCTHLGELVAGYIGIGAPEVYADACVIGLTAAAARIYDALPANAAVLAVSGTAQVAGDGLAGGVWLGTFDHAPLGLATFAGKRYNSGR